MARLSICLPVLNGADLVEDALRSIDVQTSRDFIVLAGDNASTDETRHVLDRWAARLPMQIVSQSETIPMQAHFNQLLDRVGTEAFMVLCHDDYFRSPDAVARALAAVDANPDISAIYCDLAYVSENNRLLATRRFDRAGPINADVLGRDCLRRARNMFGIPLLVRRDALARSRYDPQFHYLMDVDLSWTVSRHQPAWHIPELLIANRYRRSNMTWDLLGASTAEYRLLAAKYGIDLSPVDRARLRLTNSTVGWKRRAFGLYERMVTRFG
ncbi:MAG: glycosyltransferase [Pseudomonadota bacterium]